MSFLTNTLAVFFDVAPVGGTTIGAAAGIAFFLVFAAIAALAFFIVKRTVKMAIRMMIVAAILLIAIVGGISFWWFTSGTKPVNRPPNQRNR